MNRNQIETEELSYETLVGRLSLVNDSDESAPDHRCLP